MAKEKEFGGDIDYVRVTSLTDGGILLRVINNNNFLDLQLSAKQVEDLIDFLQEPIQEGGTA